jgi:hypothetical protein
MANPDELLQDAEDEPVDLVACVEAVERQVRLRNKAATDMLWNFNTVEMQLALGIPDAETERQLHDEAQAFQRALRLDPARTIAAMTEIDVYLILMRCDRPAEDKSLTELGNLWGHAGIQILLSEDPPERVQETLETVLNQISLQAIEAVLDRQPAKKGWPGHPSVRATTRLLLMRALREKYGEAGAAS